MASLNLGGLLITITALTLLFLLIVNTNRRSRNNYGILQQTTNPYGYNNINNNNNNPFINNYSDAGSVGINSIDPYSQNINELDALSENNFLSPNDAGGRRGIDNQLGNQRIIHSNSLFEPSSSSFANSQQLPLPPFLQQQQQQQIQQQQLIQQRQQSLSQSGNNYFGRSFNWPIIVVVVLILLFLLWIIGYSITGSNTNRVTTTTRPIITPIAVAAAIANISNNNNNNNIKTNTATNILTSTIPTTSTTSSNLNSIKTSTSVVTNNNNNNNNNILSTYNSSSPNNTPITTSKTNNPSNTNSSSSFLNSVVIESTGTASLAVHPDQIQIFLNLEATAPSDLEAKDSVNSLLSDLRTALQSAGVPSGNIVIANITTKPAYSASLLNLLSFTANSAQANFEEDYLLSKSENNENYRCNTNNNNNNNNNNSGVLSNYYSQSNSSSIADPSSFVNNLTIPATAVTAFASLNVNTSLLNADINLILAAAASNSSSFSVIFTLANSSHHKSAALLLARQNATDNAFAQAQNQHLQLGEMISELIEPNSIQVIPVTVTTNSQIAALLNRSAQQQVRILTTVHSAYSAISF